MGRAVSSRPISRQELILAIEAFVALLDEEFPITPLSEAVYCWGGNDLTEAHYRAVARVKTELFAEASEDDLDKPLQHADVALHEEG